MTSLFLLHKVETVRVCEFVNKLRLRIGMLHVLASVGGLQEFAVGMSVAIKCNSFIVCCLEPPVCLPTSV